MSFGQHAGSWQNNDEWHYTTYIIVFLESFLTKTKQRYNSPRTLSTRVNLADMSMELRLRPPHEVTELEYEMASCNGHSSYNPNRSIPGKWIAIRC